MGRRRCPTDGLNLRVRSWYDGRSRQYFSVLRAAWDRNPLFAFFRSCARLNEILRTRCSHDLANAIVKHSACLWRLDYGSGGIALVGVFHITSHEWYHVQGEFPFQLRRVAS